MAYYPSKGLASLLSVSIVIAPKFRGFFFNSRENEKNTTVNVNNIDELCIIYEKLINETTILTTSKIKLCKELILDLNKIPNDRSKILNKFVVALRQDVFVPSNIAFEDITSSGQLKLLTDLKLKNRLIQHSTFLNNILNLLQENRNVILNRMSDFELISEFGYQDIDYLKRELDKEHIALLPKNNWTNDLSC